MRLIYQLVNNYGVAIVLFTIITKILLFPISYKQQKNTLRMQLIQPKLKKLQAKYKDKPQELQQARNIWFSMARAVVSVRRCASRTAGHWDTTNSRSIPSSAIVRVSSGKRIS